MGSESPFSLAKRWPIANGGGHQCALAAAPSFCLVWYSYQTGFSPRYTNKRDIYASKMGRTIGPAFNVKKYTYSPFDIVDLMWSTLQVQQLYSIIIISLKFFFFVLFFNKTKTISPSVRKFRSVACDNLRTLRRMGLASGGFAFTVCDTLFFVKESCAPPCVCASWENRAVDEAPCGVEVRNKNKK